jgi:large subunit ribosomal protein L13e
MQNGRQRQGKGFSPEEIKQSGINAADARKLGIPVDRKRKTAHQENINALKAHAEKAKAEAKPKPEPKPEKPAESKKKPKS